MTDADHQSSVATSHPFIFAVLLFPTGAVSGYIGVTLAYDLGRNGVGAGAIGALIAVSFIPYTWKFLWAPIVDTTLSPRMWYVASAIVSSACLVAVGCVPATSASIPQLDALVFLVSLASTFNAMTAESLAAHNSPLDKKGSCGGWLQVGNIAGGGIGGGAALWLEQELPSRWMASGLLAVSFLLCPIALRALHDRSHLKSARGLPGRLAAVARDAWAVARARSGWLAILIVSLPLGTGAASNFWSAIADDWHASVNTVAMVSGVLGGVISGFGCLIGGYFSDRMDRKLCYGLYALAQAGCAVAMGLAARTEMSYIVFTLLYSITVGLTYAGFSAVTLEVIGAGAAATKYTLFASLSNFPIQFMTLAEGRIHDTQGPAVMLYAEAAICVLALVFFASVARSPGRLEPSPSP